MTSTGTQHLGGLLSGDCQLLWVATPADWHVRLPGKLAVPHYQRIKNLMTKFRALRMSIVLVGPPGYFWKLGPMRDTAGYLGLQVMRGRRCHFGLKFDRSSRLPSGSYLQVAITYARIPTNLWKCTCQTAGKPAQRAEHESFWYGQGAQRAEQRNIALSVIMTARLIVQIDYHKTQRIHTRIAQEWTMEHGLTSSLLRMPSMGPCGTTGDDEP
eukprot:8295-Pyramimonas_sp.AAC.1